MRPKFLKTRLIRYCRVLILQALLFFSVANVVASPLFNKIMNDPTYVQNLLKLIDMECASYRDHNIAYPTRDIVAMCEIPALTLQLKQIENYVSKGPKEILIPGGAKLEGFKSGILNIEFNFDPKNKSDGFSLFAVYSIRQLQLTYALERLRSVFHKWYGATLFDETYWPAIQANIKYRLNLTKLLGAAALSPCKSNLPKCLSFSDLESGALFSHLKAIRHEYTQIIHNLEQFKEGDLYQVYNFRKQLKALLKSKKFKDNSEKIFFSEEESQKIQTLLKNAVQNANALFLSTPPQGLSQIIIGLDQIEELVEIMKDKNLFDAIESAQPNPPPLDHDSLNEAYRILDSIKELA